MIHSHQGVSFSRHLGVAMENVCVILTHGHGQRLQLAPHWDGKD